MKPRTPLRLTISFSLALCPAIAGVIYSNGPLVTHPGQGAGGADASALQASLGMSALGFGAAQSLGYRVADDFTVPATGWTISSVTLYGYQTGAPTSPSTFTGVTLRIWDGPPGVAGSVVVWGDTVTNRLVSSSWSGIYRVVDYDLTATKRPIMANVAAVGITLGPGTYWLDWDFSGSGSYPGPWVPPITILGQTTTGNARQFDGQNWYYIFDSGTNTQQGLPFEINGSVGVVPEPSTLALVGLGVAAIGLARRGRTR